LHSSPVYFGTGFTVLSEEGGSVGPIANLNVVGRRKPPVSAENQTTLIKSINQSYRRLSVSDKIERAKTKFTPPFITHLKE
jgi:hypothetical protein